MNGKRKILIIEDREDVRKSLNQVAEHLKSSYAFEVPNTLSEAEECLKNTQFDLILIDGVLEGRYTPDFQRVSGGLLVDRIWGLCYNCMNDNTAIRGFSSVGGVYSNRWGEISGGKITDPKQMEVMLRDHFDKYYSDSATVYVVSPLTHKTLSKLNKRRTPLESQVKNILKSRAKNSELGRFRETLAALEENGRDPLLLYCDPKLPSVRTAELIATAKNIPKAEIRSTKDLDHLAVRDKIIVGDLKRCSEEYYEPFFESMSPGQYGHQYLRRKKNQLNIGASL